MTSLFPSHRQDSLPFRERPVGSFCRAHPGRWKTARNSSCLETSPQKNSCQQNSRQKTMASRHHLSRQESSPHPESNRLTAQGRQMAQHHETAQRSGRPMVKPHGLQSRLMNPHRNHPAFRAGVSSSNGASNSSSEVTRLPDFLRDRFELFPATHQ